MGQTVGKSIPQDGPSHGARAQACITLKPTVCLSESLLRLWDHNTGWKALDIPVTAVWGEPHVCAMAAPQKVA
jgi:hypothetical protein